MSEDPIQWDRESKPLTKFEKRPFGNTEKSANDYWKNGDWPCDRAQWKQGLVDYLRQRKILERPLIESKDWTPAMDHQFRLYMEDWTRVRKDKKLTKVMHLEGQLLKEALHLDWLLIEQGYVKPWSRHNRMIQSIMFKDWNALRQVVDISDLRGVELIKFDNTKGGKHKFKQFTTKTVTNMVAFGHAPNQSNVNEMLHEMRKGINRLFYRKVGLAIRKYDRNS